MQHRGRGCQPRAVCNVHTYAELGIGTADGLALSLGPDTQSTAGWRGGFAFSSATTMLQSGPLKRARQAHGSPPWSGTYINFLAMSHENVRRRTGRPSGPGRPARVRKTPGIVRRGEGEDELCMPLGKAQRCIAKPDQPELCVWYMV